MTGPLTEASTMTVMGNAFSVGGSTLVVVGGNVGIGTTSPGAALDVSGVVHVSSAVNAGYLSGNGQGISPLSNTGWTPSEGGGTVGDLNECDEYTFNSEGRLTGTNAPQLCALAESQVTNLTSDLANKLSASGPATFTGNLTIVGTGLGANGLTVTNGAGISAETITLTTGIVTGGLGSAISGNLSVGNSTFPGTLSVLHGITETNDINLFDATTPTATIVSVGGAVFGCSGGISTGCGVQTVGADGRIPAITSTYFANMDGSHLTNMVSTASMAGLYFPLTGSGPYMTGPIYMMKSSPYFEMQDTSDTDGTYLGDILFGNPTSNRHQIISTSQNATGVLGMNGMLIVGAAATVDTAGGNRGVVLAGHETLQPDLFVSTYNWVAIGSTNPVTNANSGLWVGGNVVSTGSYYGDGSHLTGVGSYTTLIDSNSVTWALQVGTDGALITQITTPASNSTTTIHLLDVNARSWAMTIDTNGALRTQ